MGSLFKYCYIIAFLVTFAVLLHCYDKTFLIVDWLKKLSGPGVQRVDNASYPPDKLLSNEWHSWS